MDTYAWLTLLRAAPGLASIGLALNALLLYASIAMVLAVWCDAVLGFLARKRAWNKGATHRQLDNCVDIICFVWAPVQVANSCFPVQLSISTIVFVLAASVFIVAACFRIARFNVEGLVNGRYRGLPVTYNGYIFPLTALVTHYAPALDAVVLFDVVFLLTAALMVTTRISVPEF
jgi:phosphatidylserine synthase